MKRLGKHILLRKETTLLARKPQIRRDEYGIAKHEYCRCGNSRSRSPRRSDNAHIHDENKEVVEEHIEEAHRYIHRTRKLKVSAATDNRSGHNLEL